MGDAAPVVVLAAAVELVQRPVSAWPERVVGVGDDPADGGGDRALVPRTIGETLVAGRVVEHACHSPMRLRTSEFRGRCHVCAFARMPDSTRRRSRTTEVSAVAAECPVTLGGGGLIGVIVLVAFLLLSGGGGGIGDLGALSGQTVGPGTESTDLQTDCRTGRGCERTRRLSRRRRGQQRAGALGEGSAELPTRRAPGSSRIASRPAAARRPRPWGRSTARRTGTSTSTSGSSTISSRSSAPAAAPWPRRTSWPTSTAITSRT